MSDDQKIIFLFSVEPDSKSRFERNKQKLKEIFGDSRNVMAEILSLPEVVKLTSKFYTQAVATIKEQEKEVKYSQNLHAELGSALTAVAHARLGEIDRDDLEYEMESFDIEVTEIFIQANIDDQYGQYTEFDDVVLTEDHRKLVNEAVQSIGRFVGQEISLPGKHIS